MAMFKSIPDLDVTARGRVRQYSAPKVFTLSHRPQGVVLPLIWKCIMLLLYLVCDFSVFAS